MCISLHTDSRSNPAFLDLHLESSDTNNHESRSQNHRLTDSNTASVRHDSTYQYKETSNDGVHTMGMLLFCCILLSALTGINMQSNSLKLESDKIMAEIRHIKLKSMNRCLYEESDMLGIECGQDIPNYALGTSS
jgi:hypothetical protein